MAQDTLDPTELWRALRERSAAAIAAGALHTISTRRITLVDHGVAFSVRIAENLARKAADAGKVQRTAAGPFNPFLPPEPALTVGAISDTHLAVLNKFNVVEHHLLLVTRAFEAQERLLGTDDFTALWRAMAGYDALGFYNGGTVAGASQGHKHLQLIPLPLTEGGPPLPVEPVLAAELPGEGIGRAASLPFRHLAVRLDSALYRDPKRAAGLTRGHYLAMLERLGLAPRMQAGQAVQSGPYNLLLTRRWMMLVPRSREHWETVSLNAMAFAGSLFVRDTGELERVRAAGPMTLLQAVT